MRWNVVAVMEKLSAGSATRDACLALIKSLRCWLKNKLLKETIMVMSLIDSRSCSPKHTWPASSWGTREWRCPLSRARRSEGKTVGTFKVINGWHFTLYSCMLLTHFKKLNSSEKPVAALTLQPAKKQAATSGAEKYSTDQKLPFLEGAS